MRYLPTTAATRGRFVALAIALAVALILAIVPNAPVADAQTVDDEVIIVNMQTNAVTEFAVPEWNVTAQLVVGDTIVVTFAPADNSVVNRIEFSVEGRFSVPESYFSGDGTVRAFGNGALLCTSDGPFEVLDLVTQPDGTVTSLAVDFMSPCQGIRGAVRINTDWSLNERTFIAGFVTDAGTGEPIEGIEVCAWDQDNEPGACQNTGPEGFYALRGFPDGTYFVSFFDPLGRDYAAECFRDAVQCDGPVKFLDKRQFINVGIAVNAELEPGCGWSEPTIVGTNASQTINGTPGDDVIMALGGNDVIFGNGGNDIICGGTGNDRIVTLDGDDNVNGGPGDDDVTAGAGADRLLGGAGRDRLRGGAGADIMTGGPDIDYMWGDGGADRLFGEGGSDRIRGGVGNDQLWGDSGADRMWGGDGADEMYGMGGQDEMWGGAGDDTMQGSHQSDKMWGGTGNDDIRAAGGKDKLWGGAGADVMFGGNNSDQMTGGDGIDQLNGGRGSDTCAPDPADTRQSCAVGVF